MNKKSIEWQWPNPYLDEITVKSEHTDRLGHTNNVRYLEWLERIAWSHIEALGCGWEVKEALGKAMVIIRTEIDYLSASYEGDVLILGTWITSSDLKLQSTRHFQLINRSTGKTILNAKMDFACISLKTGRPSKMPEAFIAAHEKGLRASIWG
ncbi:acyl-CoA thioesterase [Alkalimarinus sediminis]|uniref:Acyl-CoA thioesterase n=1 Tax=Alkalimarinus sediminis TaxID=1632866 RepID=A0A9E8HG73_9ALTE|nr:thioesterase family protein [Alkalimarinus sediminis]UZW73637.1 acyl-CoA thioesterase [Alkalimarinus sediminis]